MTPWEKMLLATGATYGVFKALTYRPLPAGRAVAYLFLWPGMDARPFETTVEPGGLRLMAWGTSKMALGAALLLLPRTGLFALDAVRVLLGIGFLVHLGLLDALAGFWRLRGIPVGRLFENPAASRTLGEFWGRRWNLAFHVVARDRVYRPVARRWGRGCGILAAFAFSGVLHDLLLSLPAGGGYGLPTLYFLLEGVLVLVERAWSLRGRGWTLFCLVAPVPLLFHRAFLEAIIRPLA
jgi:alginate O-acetyltransferase complex protein AlgI